MNEYNDLKDLRQGWVSGDFNYPPEFVVSGIHYRILRSSKWDFVQAIRDGRNPYIIYSTADANREEAKSKGLNQWIVLLWGTPDNLKIIPYDIRVINPYRGGAIYERAEVIGDVALIKIQLPSGVIALKGKVDTGAEISSLHVDGKPKIVGDTVKFFNRDASPNVIQAPLIDRQAVSSADGGTEYRPVVALDVEVNGKPIRNVKFNLNDRSSMKYPVLIGQNILEKSGFLVNPRQDGIREDMRWLTDDEMAMLTEEDIESLFENITPQIDLSAYNSEKIEQIYKILDESNITLSDLFKHVRTKAMERLDDLEY